MRALQYLEERRPEVTSIEVPSIGADEVLIASRSVGVCHSDIELLEGRYIIPFTYPIIPGHEWSGEIAKTGKDVAGFAVGDRVVGECVIGEDHFGFSISGAMAEFFVARPEWLHRLPESIDYTNGALVETFTIGYRALMQVGNVNASDTVAVLGAGPVGLMTVAAAHALGARTVAVEPAPQRQDFALNLGADVVVAPQDAEAVLGKETDGRGPSVVIEATGRADVMAQALELAAYRGRIGYVGIDVGSSAPAKLGLIQSKELRIMGSIGSPGVWPEALRFLDRTGIDLAPIVTGRFGIDDALDALNAAQQPREHVKAHVELNASLDSER